MRTPTDSTPPTHTSLVTGATGGVGRAVTLALARRGDHVWMLARRTDALDELSGLAGGTDRSRSRAGDLTSGDYVRESAADVLESGSGVDLLVHAAGTFAHTGVQDFAEDSYERLFDVNVRARCLLTRELLPGLRQRGGLVVFLNSSAGLRSPGGPALYAASMHAMRAAADALRQEVNPHGVRVLSVFLGRTATPMQERIHAAEERPYRPERLIQPETVADLVLSVSQLPRDAEVTDLTLRPLAPPSS